MCVLPYVGPPGAAPSDALAYMLGLEGSMINFPNESAEAVNDFETQRGGSFRVARHVTARPPLGDRPRDCRAGNRVDSRIVLSFLGHPGAPCVAEAD